MNSYVKLARSKALERLDQPLLQRKDYVDTITRLIKDSRILLLKRPEITKETGNSMLRLPELVDVSNDDFETVQTNMIALVSNALCHTAFPWLDAKNVKKPVTLMKKLVTLFVSFTARKDLLATECAWQMRTIMNTVIKKYLQKSSKKGDWSWYDEYDKQPTVSHPLDVMEGPLELDRDESLGNQSARLATYLQLRENNHKKMRQIAKLALSEGLGLGFGNKAVPQVLTKVEELLDVSIHTQLSQTLTRNHILGTQSLFGGGSPSQAGSSHAIPNGQGEQG